MTMNELNKTFAKICEEYVDEVNRFAEKVNANKEAIQRVRDIHKPVTSHEYKKINGNLERVEILGCIECEETGSGREYLVKYPCPTIKALDGDSDE